jgi:glucose-1-phosphate thymidylyltransferase
MKAVIPVAGAGTRLRPHTYTQPKPLLPVAGKAIISFIIEQLEEVGVKDFVFVIGYLGEKIKLFIENKYPQLNKEFVYQHQREGLGHAIWSAREELREADEVFIVLGDTIFDADLNVMLNSPYSCLGIKPVDNPREFGVVVLGEDGLVKGVVEKPQIPTSNKALVGLYKIREVRELLEAIDYNIRHNNRTHGEFQLTDGLMRMIRQGINFSTYTVNNWFDCGKKDILLETNAKLLDKEGYASSNLPTYENSIIIHPVSIGTGCEISNSIIGPHVTIGNNAVIKYSIVKESIIGSFSTIEEVVLQESIVGSDAAIRGLSQSLNIGDNTEIDFSK